MRVFPLLLLLAGINAGYGSLTETIDKALSHIHTSLNKPQLLAMREKLHAHESQIEKKLALSPQRQALLEEKERNTVDIHEVHLNAAGDTIEEVNRNRGIGELLYQSDIVLTEAQLEDIIQEAEGNDNDNERGKRQAKSRALKAMWPDGAVSYSFHRNASSKVRELFKKGAMEWEKDTCVNFFENSMAKERVEVMMEDGCWSYVGNVHKVQPLSLGEGCELINTAVHEIGHALGFFHTQSRHDRDQHILLNVQNIEPDELDQFSKEPSSRNENYGIPYDYGSIMHYGSKSFIAERYENDPSKHTMMPVDEKYIDTMGSPFVSFYELLMMNTHYNCLDKCKLNPASAKCAMGGFPHPRDCSKCVCPGGYGGKLCNERPSGCGRILQAKTDFQTLEDIVGDSAVKTSGQKMEFLKCNYWIEVSNSAPQGRRVEVKFVEFAPSNVATDGCYFAGVEIKTQKDQRQTGYRYCSPAYAGKAFKSESNIVPIITYSRVWSVKTVLQYRAV